MIVSFLVVTGLLMFGANVAPLPAAIIAGCATLVVSALDGKRR